MTFGIFHIGDDDLILFKACPRCGGDVDATYKEDMYCVQCAFRPPMALPGPVLVDPSAAKKEQPLATGNRTSPPVGCPRCALEDVVPLEKLRPHFNTCYRCRQCGHIFSPALPSLQSKAGA